MKTALLNLVFLLIISYFLLSCEKKTDILTPKSNPRLVIHSYISPSDTVLLVHVCATQNIYGKLDQPSILPVEVTMEDEGYLIQFSKIDSSGFCKAKHNIKPDHEYKLLVKCKGFQMATAKCHVPGLKSKFNLSIDTVTKTDPDWGDFKQHYAIIKFDDIPDEVNYYNLTVYSSGYVKNQGEFLRLLLPLGQENDLVSNADVTLNDQLKDGKPIVREFNAFTFPYEQDNINEYDITFNLLETDADFYKYNKSLRTSRGTNDPFTEYSPVFSNVSGGYGIFASYIKYQKTFKLK